MPAKAIDRMDGAMIYGDIQRKIADARYNLQSSMTAGDALEIVLGSETDKAVSKFASEMSLVKKKDGSPANDPIKSLKDAQLSGVPVIVDDGTPHLWAVRRRLKKM
jgi:hypothetical protein